MNTQRGFVSILLILLGLTVVGGGIYFYIEETSKGIKEIPVACTMDAKQCSDGSYVGRTGPNCEFVCPDQEKNLPITNELQKQDSVYSNSDFGFYFKYPGGYVLSEDDKGQINLLFSSMRRPVVITESVGQADDSTGKWGKYVISHSDTGWIVESANERDGGTTKQSIKPSAHTGSGLPIFNGGTNGHDWGAYSYIVALSESKFLIISGPDKLDENALEYNEKDDPTLIIAKRISVIK